MSENFKFVDIADSFFYRNGREDDENVLFIVYKKGENLKLNCLHFAKSGLKTHEDPFNFKYWHEYSDKCEQILKDNKIKYIKSP